MIEDIKGWIRDVLIGPDGYFRPAGFESSIRLYSTPLGGSFVLALIDGSARHAPFSVPEGRSRYNELVRAVQRASDGEVAYWFYITEPDNALSVLEWVHRCHYDHSLDHHLESFERFPAAEGGCSYLGLVGTSKQWLLLHEYNPCNTFGIGVLGPREICRQVAAAVGVEG